MSTQLVEVRASQSGYASVTFEWIGYHNVWQFKDKAAFDSCDFDKAKEMAFRSGYVFLSSRGTYYFGCSVYGHCSAGQKLQLVIEDNTEKTGFMSRASARMRISLVQSKSLSCLNQWFLLCARCSMA